MANTSKVTRVKGYPSGSAGYIGEITLIKWSENYWSASANRKARHVWAKTALAAFRLANIK